MTVGIYKITNKITNKLYIGESLNIEKRWIKHKEDLKNNSHHSYKLQNDYNGFGLDNFNFDIIENVDYELNPFVKKLVLLALEDRYIKEFDSINFGYNIEDTLDLILKGKKSIFQNNESLSESYKKLLLSIIHNLNINDGKYINSRFDKYYIRVPISWYDDLNISNIELTILLLLYKNYTELKSTSLCSVDMLCDFMCINSNTNKRILNVVRNTISSLVDKELITGLYDLYYNNIDISEVKNKNTFFYIELPSPPEKAYLIIYENELYKIFNYLSGSNLGKFSLIRYFIACRRSINNESNFGYLTQGKLKQLVTDSRTIQRYNKILQDDLHLIKYNNDYLTPEKQYCTTFIGLYDDKNNFDFQLKAEVDRQGLVYTDKINSNTKRSITQQINNKSFDF